MTAAEYQQLLESSGTSVQEWKQYQIAVATNITQLQSELEERDEEIEALKAKYEKEDQRQNALIKKLEDEKRESDKEDQRQDALINSQQQQIEEQHEAMKDQQQQIADMQITLKKLLGTNY